MLLLYSFISLLLLGFLSILISPIFLSYRKNMLVKPFTDLWLYAGLLVVLPIIALFLYGKWGSREALSQFYAVSSISTAMQSRNVDSSQVQAITQKFIIYLKTHPQDTKGWYLLGRLYLDQGNLQKSVDAFKQSFESDDGKNSEVMAQYAQALYLFHHQQLNGESLKLIQEALSQDPKNMTALNLLAMDAFQRHRYALAMTYWKRLRNQYQEGSPEFTTLTSAIEVCEKKI